ncbi:CDP-alcohol phosphatidyltransferase family protein [Candidatus Thorarchaeota archaeon]|nr:MAG: CDP-alcohol phosphatidyltransferase family protein [Candidatus Thorarchaeota archaeon]
MDSHLPSRFRVRGSFKGIVLLIAKPLAKAGLSPDSVTYISLLFAFFAFLSLPLTHSTLLYGILTFIAGLLDGVDGNIARLTNSASNSGGLTDSVIDKVSEMLILAAIAFEYTNSLLLSLPVSIWVLLAVFGWLMTSYTRARAQSLGVTDLDIGIGGRSERLLTLVIFSVFGLILWGLLIVTIMGLGTAAYRLYHYRLQLRRESTSN